MPLRHADIFMMLMLLRSAILLLDAMLLQMLSDGAFAAIFRRHHAVFARYYAERAGATLQRPMRHAITRYAATLCCSLC